MEVVKITLDPMSSFQTKVTSLLPWVIIYDQSLSMLSIDTYGHLLIPFYLQYSQFHQKDSIEAFWFPLLQPPLDLKRQHIIDKRVHMQIYSGMDMRWVSKALVSYILQENVDNKFQGCIVPPTI